MNPIENWRHRLDLGGPFGPIGHTLGMNSRVHPKYKTKYRVTNWPEYDRALVQRGNITLWISDDAIVSWKPAPTGLRGAQSGSGSRIFSATSRSPSLGSGFGSGARSHKPHQRRSRMVEISLAGSGEGPGWATAPGYSTAPFSAPPILRILTTRPQ
jgi:hypothetical protein